MKKILIPAIAAALFVSQTGNTQVAYLMDMLTSQICLANNWDSAALKQQLAHLDARQYQSLRLELEMQLSQSGFVCLMEKRILPEKGCTRVIDDMLQQHNPPVGGGNPFLSDDSKAQISEALLEEAMSQCLMPAADAITP